MKVVVIYLGLSKRHSGGKSETGNVILHLGKPKLFHLHVCSDMNIYSRYKVTFNGGEILHPKINNRNL